jgi:hypothetical protein
MAQPGFWLTVGLPLGPLRGKGDQVDRKNRASDEVRRRYRFLVGLSFEHADI